MKLHVIGKQVLLLVLGLTWLSAPLAAAEALRSPKPTIVLVHGAFADAAGSWGHVITHLEQNGYPTIAVQNPLTSFADDVATTRRVIDAQKGPVIVVGHSYGGAVMTRAAYGAANVKGLVYVAAFAPDAGEVIGPLLQQYPSKLGTALVPDAAGFLYIDRAKFAEAFAADVPEKERNVMAATQKPVAGAILAQQFEAPAWKEVPTWYLVATQDNAIHPELQRFFAKRMNAVTSEVTASHVPIVSRPEVVVAVVEKAATAAAKP
jgi:pimeloyl-ACP methyl ester carboxylesterase